MANKGTVSAFVHFVGDGSSTTFVTSFLTGPFGFFPPNGGTYSATFDIATTLPTAIRNVTCNNGLGASATIGLAGIVTFTLTGGTPVNGTDYQIGMDLDF